MSGDVTTRHVVEFLVEGERIVADRALLSRKCTFFNNMFRFARTSPPRSFVTLHVVSLVTVSHDAIFGSCNPSTPTSTTFSTQTGLVHTPHHISLIQTPPLTVLAPFSASKCFVWQQIPLILVILVTIYL